MTHTLNVSEVTFLYSVVFQSFGCTNSEESYSTVEADHMFIIT